MPINTASTGLGITMVAARISHLKMLLCCAAFALQGCGGGASSGSGENDGVELPQGISGERIEFKSTSATGSGVTGTIVFEFSAGNRVTGTNPYDGRKYTPDSYSYRHSGNSAVIRLSYESTSPGAWEEYRLRSRTCDAGNYDSVAMYEGQTSTTAGTYLILGSDCNRDDDRDGVVNSEDAFPDDPNEQKDSDGDGMGDNADEFPSDPNEQVDSDGDGVGDNGDDFPNDPSRTEDVDSDGDGVVDNKDAFPNDPSEQSDSDGDGVGDNADAFPSDASEQTDTDGDGRGDNADAYPNDPTRFTLNGSILDKVGSDWVREVYVRRMDHLERQDQPDLNYRFDGNYDGNPRKDFIIQRQLRSSAYYLVYNVDDLGSSISLGPSTIESQFRVTEFVNAKALGFVGDVDGDGIEDLLIEREANSNTQTTSATVLFYGATDGWPAQIDLNNTASYPFRHTVFSFNESPGVGPSFPRLKRLGDINGDGFADMAFFLSGQNASSASAGRDARFYFVLGRANGYEASHIFYPLAEGREPHYFEIPDARSISNGMLISGIGDFNRDGVDDFVVHVRDDDYSEFQLFIVFGLREIDWSGKGLRALVVDGLAKAVALGNVRPDEPVYLLSSKDLFMGDVNGDGFDDFRWGNLIIFGNDDESDFVEARRNDIDGGDALLVTSTNRHEGRIYSNCPGSGSVRRISRVGDFNGDGIDDFVNGCYGVGTQNISGSGGSTSETFGAAMLVFGASVFPTELDVSKLGGGSDGFELIGSGKVHKGFGYTVYPVGDFNNDGLDDFAIIALRHLEPSDGSVNAGVFYFVMGCNKSDRPCS